MKVAIFIFEPAPYQEKAEEASGGFFGGAPHKLRQDRAMAQARSSQEKADGLSAADETAKDPLKKARPKPGQLRVATEKTIC
ncbi:hypothetical protein [Rhizorhapis suberifaciens]|uniref:Uncharacterized protein n=1 Tax=Rhizorhapis suberifaciens TaxID=13656 RepID=A0A840HTK1_9SPHN|nr:hypothetical protein [Rhizorhapis suberifaciens]MBB4640888.1 hypothetical protein [Rhizorhapis suberifaciens]